jgi:hypothetical protein
MFPLTFLETSRTLGCCFERRKLMHLFSDQCCSHSHTDRGTMPRSPFPELSFRITERGRRGTVAGTCLGREWGRCTKMNRIKRRGQRTSNSVGRRWRRRRGLPTSNGGGGAGVERCGLPTSDGGGESSSHRPAAVVLGSSGVASQDRSVEREILKCNPLFACLL